MTKWAPSLQADLKPVALQITESLERDIRSGALPPGTQLPTQRELAGHLGISLGTVTRAFNLARQRGLIEGTTGRGTFVSIFRHGPAQSNIIDLSHNFFLCETPDPAIRATLARMGAQAQMQTLFDYYQPPEGPERHRAAGAAWISRGDWKVEPARLVVCGGGQHALLCALASAAKPGATLLTESLTYPGVKWAAQILGLPLRGVEIDSEGLRPDSLEAICRETGAQLLYTVPTLHNPTAAIMSDARRRAIAGICRRRQVTIIEDDVYGFLAEDPPPPLAYYAPENSYYVTGLSKCLAPGLRVGYAVGPPGSSFRLAQAVRATMVEAPPLMAQLVSRWIEDGTVQRVIGWKREETRSRFDMARRIFGVPDTAVPAGHIWIPVPPPGRAEDVVARARGCGILINSAETFAVDQGAAPQAIRVCLGPESGSARLEKAMTTLAGLLGERTSAAVTVM
jgi:DNA-binding transcriptional MocR family regulator